jgi:adenine-specific DNA-methyltransferase
MIAVRRHTGVNGISLRGGRAVGVSRVGSLERWSGLGRTTGTKPQEAKLGDYFRVSRGQVTGGNGLWIVNGESGVPSRFLMPTITRAKELIAVGPVLASLSGLKTVADLPKELDDLDQSDRAAVERFLRCVKSAGGANSYIAQHRSPWWSVRLLPPAPILCTYMARRAPAFVLNAAGARHLNIAHGLYPRMEVDANTLDAVVRWLRKNVGTDGGRTEGFKRA